MIAHTTAAAAPLLLSHGTADRIVPYKQSVELKRPLELSVATVDVIDIFRVVDGRIAEHWGVLDWLGLLRQLGARPTVPPAA